MAVYLLILFCLCLICPGSRLNIQGIRTDYISREQTDVIRGLFILMIIASHYAWSLPDLADSLGRIYQRIWIWQEQLVVVCFLFYSGYGIAESVRKKGRSYLRSFPRQRMLRVYCYYVLAQLFFVALNICLGIPMEKPWLAFLMLASIGCDNWYFFTILCLYAISLLGFVLFRKNEVRAAALITALSILMILLMRRADLPNFWYNTVMCYSAGIWFSIYREKIEKALRHLPVYLALLLVTALGFTWLFMHRGNLAAYELHAVFFAMLVVLVTMKLRLASPGLAWCGKNLTSIFLIHRIPMILLLQTGLIHSVYLRFVLILVLIFPLAYLFGKLMKAVNRLPVFREPVR